MELTLANPQPDWSDLQTDLLELILTKLAFIDILRFGCVCCSWNGAVRSYKACPVYAPPQTLWLMQLNTEEDVDRKAEVTCTFFSTLSGNKVCQVNNVFRGFDYGWCVGWTKGWLVVLDKTILPHLVNPLSGVTIQLPLAPSGYEAVTYSMMIYVIKAVLLSNPTRKKDFTVVVRYRYLKKLTFCKFGDNKWTEFGDELQDYRDMIHRSDGKLFVMYGSEFMVELEAWDFDEGPCPKKVIKLRCPMRLIPRQPYRNVDKKNVDGKKVSGFRAQCYLVESKGEMFLLLRIAYLYSNADAGNNDSTHQFVIYKVVDGVGITRVSDLPGRALFISRNESVSVAGINLPAECQENSIYFIENHCPSSHGCETVAYNLKEGKILGDGFPCNFKTDDEQPSNPKCFWFLPSPW